MIPEGKCGDWAVETFVITEQEASFANMRAAFGHPLERVSAGTYQKLTHKGGIVMSNTPMERRTHSPILYCGKGHVLLNGLGLGFVLRELLSKKSVTKITVNELAPEVIELVGKSFADARVQINHADAFTWKPSPKCRFEAVWHDIWNDICEDNLKQMTTLCRSYGKWTQWQECWSRNELKAKMR